MSKFQSRAGASEGILAYTQPNNKQKPYTNSTDSSGVHPSIAACSLSSAVAAAPTPSSSATLVTNTTDMILQSSHNKQSNKKRRNKKHTQQLHMNGPSADVDASFPSLPLSDSMSVSKRMQESKQLLDARPQLTSNASDGAGQHKRNNGEYTTTAIFPSPSSSSTASSAPAPAYASSSSQQQQEFQPVQSRRCRGNRHKMLEKQQLINGEEKQDSSKDLSAHSTPSTSSSASAPPPAASSSWTTVPLHRSSPLIHSINQQQQQQHQQQRAKEHNKQMNGKRRFAANPFPVSNSSTSSPLLVRCKQTSVLPSSPKVREGWESLQPHPTVAAMVARTNQTKDAKSILGASDATIPPCNPAAPASVPTSHRRLFDRESPACKSLVGVLTAANSSFKQTSNSTPPVAITNGYMNSLPHGASSATNNSFHLSPAAHPQLTPAKANANNHTTAPHPSHPCPQQKYLLPHPQSCVSAPPAQLSNTPNTSQRRSLFQVAIGDVLNSSQSVQRRSRRGSISGSSSAHSSRESSPYLSRSSSEFNSQRASPLLQQSSSAPASPAQSRALKMQLLVEKQQREREIMRQAEALRQIQAQLELDGEGSENDTEVTADDDDVDSTLSPCSLKRVSSTPQLSVNHSLSATPTSFYANSRDKHMSASNSLNSSFDRHRRGQAEVIATQMAQAAAVEAKQQALASEHDESGNVTEHDDISHADDEEEVDGDHLEGDEAAPVEDEEDGELINADSLESDIDSSASFASDDEIESPDAEVTSSGSRLRTRESNASTTASNNSDSSTPNSSHGSSCSSSHSSHANSPHDTDPAILTAAQLLQPAAARRFSKLHDEILTICGYVGPKAEVEQIRRSVSKRVSDKIWEKYPDVEVHVIGSCATNLFLPDSDIDLVIRNPHGKPPLTTADLYALGKHLEPLCNHVNVISTASVPLIKLVERESRLTVDLTLNVETGLYSTSFVIEQLETYPEVLHQLTIVLKHYLKKECLNDLYSGGLPSYSLILMIVSFLQQHPQEKQRQRSRRSSVEESDMADLHSHSLQSLSSCRISARPHSPDEDDAAVAKYSDWNQQSNAVNMTLRTQLKKGGQGELLESPSNSASAALSTPVSSPAAGSRPFDASTVDLGEYLLSFFYLYGKTFDYETKGISVRGGGEIFDKKERGFLRDNPFLLCLENPMDPTVDLGFKTFRIKEIQKAFLKGYETLRSGRGFGNASEQPPHQAKHEPHLESVELQAGIEEHQAAELSQPHPHQFAQPLQQLPQPMHHQVAPLMYHSMPASPAFYPVVAPSSMPDLNHFHLQQFPPASFSHPASLPHSSSHSSVMHSANHSPYLLHANVGNGNMLIPTFDLDSNSAPPAMHHMYHAGLLPFPPGVPLINNVGMPMNYGHGVAPLMPMNHTHHHNNMKTFKPPVPKPQKQRVNA